MTPDVQATFRALSDPTRRQILLDLSRKEMTIGEVVERFDITRGAVRKHLAILEQGRLISVHARGRSRISRLEPSGLKSASDWINYFSVFWDEHLGSLEKAIKNAKRGDQDV